MTNSSKPSFKSSFKSGFKPIRTLVAENEAILPMLRQLEFISKLQKTFVDIVPPNLSGASRIAAVEGSTIVVAAVNGHAATILRQMLPSLLQKFRENQKQEQKVTAIRVIVQPTMAEGGGNARTRTMSAITGEPMPLGAIERLANSLSESPLKATMQQMQLRRERAHTRPKSAKK